MIYLLAGSIAYFAVSYEMFLNCACYRRRAPRRRCASPDPMLDCAIWEELR